MSEQALVCVKDEDSEAEAVSPVVKGRQRKEWKLIATDELQQGEDLRRGAQRWLRAKDIPHKTLTKSSNKGAFTLIARCSSTRVGTMRLRSCLKRMCKPQNATNVKHSPKRCCYRETSRGD